MADDITSLIEAANRGDATARDVLFARVYGELKHLAHRQLAGPHPTLDTTGLVHEAYLKLVEGDTRDLQGRHHFFALAAKAMRQIVIDHARARAADKRGGTHLELVGLDEARGVADGALGPEELLRLDRALLELEHVEPRLARLVELRFFAGLPFGDIAKLRDVSERTLERDWRRAKARLHAELYPET